MNALGRVRKFARPSLLTAVGFISATCAAGCATTAASRDRPQREVNLSQVTQLTHCFDRAGEAYFSPDMKWIVFQATPKGETDYAMYVAPFSTAIPKFDPRAAMAIAPPIRITPPGSKNTCGFFSPDGRSLIFGSTAGTQPATRPATEPGAPASGGYQRSTGTYRWEFPPEMEIFRADGWESAAPAAADRDKGTNLARHALTRNDAYDAECAFAPDGRWIVFTSNRTGDAELFAMRANGSDPVQLTRARGYDGGPFFSPDGRQLVYRSDRAGNDLLQIYVADVVRDKAGNITGIARERKLTKDNNVNWGPYWHPGGKHIIYATSAHGHQNYELYLMRRDGSRKTRVTFTEGFDGLPVFSPDGRWLMWSSKRTADRTTQVFIARFELPRGS